MARKSTPNRKPPSRSAKSKAKPKGAGEKEAQYARFLAMAEELGTSKDPKDFDKAFKRVTASSPKAR